MLGLRLSVLLLGAPADLPAPPEAPSISASTPTSGRVIVRVWLRGAGLDADALAEAVATRLTDKQILAAGQAAGPIAGLVALCHVTAQDGQLVLEVVLGDGRVYQRKITAPAAGRERTAARLIAATLASIEDETARPDRSDGVFVAPVAVSSEPLRGPEATMPTAVQDDASAAGPVAAGRGAVGAGAGRPVDTRAPATTPAATTERPRQDATGAARTLELGVALELGASFGLGAPAAGAGLAGGGGGLRVDLKLRRSLLLGAGFRGHTRLHDGLALGRFRGAAVVGHLLRRGAFELTTLVGPTLETWQVTQDGAPVKYTTTSSSGASLLLGGLARVGLGGRVQRRGMSARIGGYVELAGSARSSGRVPQIARAAGQAPVFVLGGAELSLGVEVELWFALRSRR
ncbi:hypothetical protein [Nannocystis sp.]|uniref:hypothetical protein n=1 Tax=Nannocystis sp. TaxID=1962667 RepID=UPI0025D5914A|nr:hypothetical protein [Nannocystis sp.]MBK7826372.1 hypothetical protein [Nannocystis sp.]